MKPNEPLSQTQQHDLPLRQPAATGAERDTPAGPETHPGEELVPGAVLAGRYEIRRRLGQGGMGVVYAAFDRVRNEEVALKLLLPHLLADPKARERFTAEAQVAGSLDHPNIVRVHDLHQDGTHTFLSMELLQGRSLRDEILHRGQSGQRFTPEEVRDLAASLVAALGQAHGRGVVHRDVKPENIWLCADGTVKLMDFGIARLMRPSQFTSTGLALGTAYYMAPEQLKGSADIDHRADQYAVGVVLYELLTGEVPVGAVKAPHLLRKSLPLGLSQAVMRALEGRPEDRHPDMTSLQAALLSNRVGRPLARLIPILAAVLLGAIASGWWAWGWFGTGGGESNPSSTLAAEKQAAASRQVEDAALQKRLHVEAADAQSRAAQAIEQAGMIAKDLAGLVQESEASLRAGEDGGPDAERQAVRLVLQDRKRLAEAYKENQQLAQMLKAAVTDLQTGRTLLQQYPADATARFHKALAAAERLLTWWQNTQQAAARSAKLRMRMVTAQRALTDLLPSNLYDGVQQRLEGWWMTAQKETGMEALNQVQTAEKLCDGVDKLLTRRRAHAAFAQDAEANSPFVLALRKGDAALSSGDLEAAAGAYASAEGSFRNAEAAFRKRTAVSALKAKDYPRALAQATRWQELEPQLAEPMALRGRAHLGKSAWANALQDAAKALELDAGYEPALLIQAQAYLGLRQYQKAEEVASSAIQRNASCAEAYVTRSRARTAQCKDRDAISDASRAIELLPGSPEAWVTRAQASLEKWDCASAIRDCTKAMEIDPQWSETFVVLAHAHARARNYELALDACKKALELEPKSARFYTARAAVLSAKGDYAAAVTEATQALKLDPDSVPARLEQGLALAKAGKTTEALMDINAAIKREPDNPEGYLRRSLVRAAQLTRDFEDLWRTKPRSIPSLDLGTARADAEQALKLCSTAEYLQRRAELEFVDIRDAAHAWPYLAKAERLRATPEVNLRLGQLYGHNSHTYLYHYDIKHIRICFAKDAGSRVNWDNSNSTQNFLYSHEAKELFFRVGMDYLALAQDQDPKDARIYFARAKICQLSAGRWYSKKWDDLSMFRSRKESFLESKKEYDDWLRKYGESDRTFREYMLRDRKAMDAEWAKWKNIRYRGIELCKKALAELKTAEGLGGRPEDAGYRGEDWWLSVPTEKNLHALLQQALKLEQECSYPR
jgi:predicted Zn-dependent protease